MSSRRHGPTPDDHEDDPTGVRELLSGLPDPGPIPDHLTDRIAASLGEDARQGHHHRASEVSALRSTVPGQRVVSSGTGIAAELDRAWAARRSGVWLSAVAAVVVVGAVGAAVYVQLIGFDEAPEAVAQYLPTDDTAAEQPPGEQAAAGDRGTADGTPTQNSASAASAGELSAARAQALSGIDEDTFASGAEALLVGAAAGTAPGALPSAFELIDAQVQPLPPLETRRCVRATGQSPEGSGWVAAPASVADVDVVLVSDTEAAQPRAWAVSPECVADSSARVLHGPTTLR